MKLSAANLKKLKPREKRYDVKLEGKGLWARVYPSGQIAVQYLYLIHKGYSRRRMTLGYFPKDGIAYLEAEYHDKSMLRGRKEDPQEEKVEAEQRKAVAAQKAKLAKTVAELGGQFIEEHSKREKRARSAREDQRILEKEIIPVIGKLRVEEVERRQLVELIERITRRGSPVMANRVRAFLSKFFNWAVDRSVLEASPATRLPANRKAEKVRTRVLSDEELRAFWTAIDGLENPMHQAAIRTLLLTGQRRAEVARLARSEISGEWWTITEERAKNGIAHRVYLGSLTRKCLKGDGEWVFPSKAANHVNPDTLTDTVPKIAALAGIEHCRTHDLRRTVGTFVQRKYGAEVMHKVLNHAGDRLTRVYGQYDYDKEKRAALRAWARHIEEVAAGSKSTKVINLNERRA
ncbi:MAG: tyrosine-type recombinase/integrase [Kiritimatiellia bacterium]|nr:tyrosine-type recombinase/integrase [Kiritimatiellia bacterium]